jgi:transcriptional regulator with XRE-family HTH domain
MGIGGFMAIPIYERLKAVRTALKLSQRHISKEIYTAQSVYARMEKGISPINDRTIELVCYRFNVNRAYLREGKNEPMFCDIPQDVKLDQLYQIFEGLNGLFQDYLILQAKELLKVQKQQGGETKPAPNNKKRHTGHRKGKTI